jgi:Domain of unknown function (DUF4398)
MDYHAPMRFGLVCLGLLPLLGGCAARASFQLLNADRAYQAAVGEGAEKYAPYEMTLAKEYLAKAKEKGARSSFKAAHDLALASQDYANTAVNVASERKALSEGNDDIVPEERVEKAPEEKDDVQIDINVDSP